MALKPKKTETVTADKDTDTTSVATEVVSEIQSAVTAARPVKLKAVQYRIRNPHTNVMYYPHVATDLIDFNADSAFFERSQVAAGVLIIVEG